MFRGDAPGVNHPRRDPRKGDRGEMAVCCVNVGTVDRHKPAQRLRPEPERFTRTF